MNLLVLEYEIAKRDDDRSSRSSSIVLTGGTGAIVGGVFGHSLGEFAGESRNAVIADEMARKRANKKVGHYQTITPLQHREHSRMRRRAEGRALKRLNARSARKGMLIGAPVGGATAALYSAYRNRARD